MAKANSFNCLGNPNVKSRAISSEDLLMNGIVYKITNRQNGKVYIGLTTHTLARRRSEHLQRLTSGVRDHRIYLAFKKYGFENFDWEILEESNDIASGERRYISKYDSMNKGYNMTDGGGGVCEETRKKLSKIFKGRQITWAHKIVETRRKRNNYISKPPRGSKSSLSKKYVVIEPDGTRHIVHGLRKWCRDWRKEKLFHNSLICVAQGKYKQYKGYRCKYLADTLNSLMNNVQRPAVRRTLKRVETGSTPQG